MDQEQPLRTDSEGSDSAGSKPAGSAKSETWEWIKALLIAGVLVIVIRVFLFAPFIVEGPSMEPNFYTGERLIVNKLVYDFRQPKRGEVIVLHAPEGKDYIKRVIGLPGETVKVEGDNVFVNGKVIDEPWIKDAVNREHQKGGLYNPSKNFPETKVPDDAVFVLGDHRSVSKDSRYEDPGFIPLNKVVGRADIRFWPIQAIGIIKHG
ncbi:signal peptidase I [Gordoniibacillus kamchatkensis]|uniref:Signal peptidase I n=1 Tax=Gordoniibacillus kamchatkensis TaxID=1590651 RepID=A0ABR5A6Z7_9BACL|nr:signal peptidase I [Paenibacillus sp. VKM B-2647]KIL36563.1 signal peptidase I [Paenibacillus sp. VKM B-2647]